ncbi:maltase A2 [Bactrocera dorsalis]|uniref:alpha-glucosidase n=1 Tax=Bactrocera dorsalis TaxID=27457 RepID=A0A8N4L0R0_BACDO|nr:maltase A2 [Bactrocera dorsalis]
MIVFIEMSLSLIRLSAAMLLCALGATANQTVDWWESATLYQIYPRSFMDSDGDGVGDLNGITSRLSYLKEIGATATWISPIYDSPMADMGYDVRNFTKISSIFGTMEDFDNLLAKAHELGLKVILDFVPNHSSDECEWFQKSVRREDGYDDWYVWDDGKIDPETGERSPPSNWRAVFGGSAWTWVEERQQYYLHQFLPQQVDLNYTNPAVRERMKEMMKFWLDRGVDGFRMDATNFLIEKRFDNGTFPDNPVKAGTVNTLAGTYTIDQWGSTEIIYEWRAFLDEYQKLNGGDTRAMIIEAYSPVDVLSNYISNGTNVGGQLPMNFNFVKLDENSNAETVETQVSAWMDVIWAKHKMANWVANNHDNSRLPTRMGQTKTDAMTMIIHGLPGTSVTYYGEEIGMPDYSLACTGDDCGFRDPERTPMQWDSSKNAGFSTGNSTWLAVNPNYKELNVEVQDGVTRSSLRIFKGMTALKKTAAFKAFKEKDAFSYKALSEHVFQVVRTAVGQEEYRVLANLGNQTEHFDGLSDKKMKYVLLNSYSPHSYGHKVDLSGRISLKPYEAVVLGWSKDKSCTKTKKVKHVGHVKKGRKLRHH